MKPEITLLVHNIRSTHNVGAIFRTAEGFGIKEIILSGYTPYPDQRIIGEPDPRLPHIAEKLTAQIHKTALGAETMVPFRYMPTIEEWLADNQQGERLPVIALEQSATSVILPEFTPPSAFALLLGEEVHGIEPALLRQCDHTVEIPMFGQKESFNVSVATGIALFGLLFAKIY
ncbi:MAG: TrmH family RNA methyltransferase [Candidatus Saccharibacteria bacterium]|nr:TrmH family RNA methyltransferase [Candidatus Saccharibacteria bacterium]